MLSVPDVEKFPDVMDALPRTIVFECVWPSEQTARQANWIDSTDVGVTVKEIGKPWLVVPTKSRGKDVTCAEGVAGDESTVRVTVVVDPPQPATVRIESSNAATIPAPDSRRVLSDLGARPRSSISSSIDSVIDLSQPLLEQRRLSGRLPGPPSFSVAASASCQEQRSRAPPRLRSGRRPHASEH